MCTFVFHMRYKACLVQKKRERESEREETVVKGTCKIQRELASIEVEFQTLFQVNKSGFAYNALWELVGKLN